MTSSTLWLHLLFVIGLTPSTDHWAIHFLYDWGHRYTPTSASKMLQLSPCRMLAQSSCHKRNNSPHLPAYNEEMVWAAVLYVTLLGIEHSLECPNHHFPNFLAKSHHLSPQDSASILITAPKDSLQGIWEWPSEKQLESFYDAGMRIKDFCVELFQFSL